MLAKLLPIILVLLGTGGGIAAGLYLTPGAGVDSENAGFGGGDLPGDSKNQLTTMMDSQGNVIDASATEFMKMSNQFVVPVIKNDMIASLVVVSLSLETRVGVSEEIYAREPKLRDAFLRVLFDHANMGGFHGEFTNADTLDLLRDALRQVARNVAGADIVDVLIADIIRQDS